MDNTYMQVPLNEYRKLLADRAALLEALELLMACNAWCGGVDRGDAARLATARAAIAQAKGEK